MGQEIINFGEIQIENRKLHYRENLILVKDKDIKMQFPSTVSSGEKIINIVMVTKMMHNLSKIECMCKML